MDFSGSEPTKGFIVSTGIIFSRYNIPIHRRISTKCLKDKQGTLWFGCSDGAVLCQKQNRLISVPLSNSKSISELIEGPDGLIYVIPQGKTVYSINPLNPEEVHQYAVRLSLLCSQLSLQKTGYLLLGHPGKSHACRLGKDSVSVIKVIAGSDSMVLLPYIRLMMDHVS